MEVARQYTEQWLHQQQMRDTMGDLGLLTRELFHPLLDIFMRALPHTFRDVYAEEQTSVCVTVNSEIGGTWSVIRNRGKWHLTEETIVSPTASVAIDPDTAWKLFSKSWRLNDTQDRVTITGDEQLAQIALSMVAVMA
jgi:hypothetical protein